jgi:hypothetical protein
MEYAGWAPMVSFPTEIEANRSYIGQRDTVLENCKASAERVEGALKAALQTAEGRAALYNGVVACAQGVLQAHYRSPDSELRLDHLERALDEATPDWRETLTLPAGTLAAGETLQLRAKGHFAEPETEGA